MALLFSQVAIPHASRHFFVAILTAPLDDAILQGDQGATPERVKQQRASQQWRRVPNPTGFPYIKWTISWKSPAKEGYLNPICQNSATTILQRLWIPLALNLASYFLAQPHLSKTDLILASKGKTLQVHENTGATKVLLKSRFLVRATFLPGYQVIALLRNPAAL